MMFLLQRHLIEKLALTKKPTPERVLPLLLTAVLGLTPQLVQAFAFDTAVGPVVRQHQTVGNPVVWDPPRVTMSVHLGSLPTGVTLVNSTTSWDTNVAEALAL